MSEEENKKERRFSQKQYDMLNRCSYKKNMTEWNRWRKESLPPEDIELEGARLDNCYLEGVHLDKRGVDFISENGKIDTSRKWYSNVYLKGAHLNHTHLEGARLMGANLEGARLWFSHIEGADIADACLVDAHCQRATVDGSTSLWECKVNRKTNFLGVNLDVVKIDPATKQLLKYNVRRRNWEEWYEEQPWWLRSAVREFWRISDYGISTNRVIITFFRWALIFAAVYLAWGLIDYYLLGLKDNPGIVSNLFVLEDGREAVSPWLVPFRAIYFSIVTMTTLGFGDMYASAHSFLRGLFGHALLALQVILGYVLLGALITRFAVLFTAGGPAGKFAKERKNKG